ncbi:hypothetical protein KNT92_gp060 [Klebsiella phage Mineola]|uniref:Uncharacterized protein n=1 Tax=Klebsiella phage Mineola TaxID=2234047 RepID=A0A2Z4QAN9_9CAUD|nr:hypothetical protein KNT92_gp060 [Klebsiella phage Mineola]AWY06955.1 hypothetical protein CPT_Mineola_060 [Klebsiella phage Mineola]UCR74271.1 hypothetical protein [Klebsiella phage vB_KpnM_5N]UJP30248.1 hypothetical protein [Klebsiella phage Kpn6N]
MKLNQNGCPSRVRFCILELRSNIIVIDEYTTIVGVQQYLDRRFDTRTHMKYGFPGKCKFYPMSADHQSVVNDEYKWAEGLTLKELEEYLDA